MVKAVPEHQGTSEEQIKWEQERENYMKNNKIEGDVCVCGGGYTGKSQAAQAIALL